MLNYDSRGSHTHRFEFLSEFLKQCLSGSLRDECSERWECDLSWRLNFIFRKGRRTQMKNEFKGGLIIER